MSVTWSPPVVWKWRSAWKTFIGDEFNQYCRLRGPVAQRLEQRTHNSLVPGSNPGGPSFQVPLGMKSVGVGPWRYESGRKSFFALYLQKSCCFTPGCFLRETSLAQPTKEQT